VVHPWYASISVLIEEVSWNDWNEDRIARHAVTTSEVEEVIFGDDKMARRKE